MLRLPSSSWGSGGGGGRVTRRERGAHFSFCALRLLAESPVRAHLAILVALVAKVCVRPRARQSFRDLLPAGILCKRQNERLGANYRPVAVDRLEDSRARLGRKNKAHRSRQLMTSTVSRTKSGTLKL